MNERIRELLYEAGGEYGGELPTTGETLIYTEEVDYEKFAHLIVQSILNSLETEREYYANPGTYQALEYYTKMSAKREAINDAISLIRNDFGVEQ